MTGKFMMTNQQYLTWQFTKDYS